jgi:predicted Zn-dependent protease with MMP-like domain
MQISKQQFEQFVAQAIDGVPEKYRAWINNLAFFVEDYPTEDQLRKVKLSKRSDVTLLGLYEAIIKQKGSILDWFSLTGLRYSKSLLKVCVERRRN